jgi:hypothetical protein
MFVGVLLLGAAGVAAALWLRRRDGAITLDNALARAPHLYAIAVIMFALGGVALAAYLHPRWLWALPLALEASFSALVWRSVVALMAFGFALTTTLAFAAQSPRRWSLMIGSLALVVALALFAAERSRPIAPELRAVERDGVVLQSSGVSCVSASAANLLRLHGVTVTEAQMAELTGATRDGATSAQLLVGLSEMGLDGRRSFHADRDLSRVPLPAVIFYGDEYGTPHAVVLAERGVDDAVILDPLRGRVVLPRSAVEAWWDGEAVTCAASP